LVRSIIDERQEKSFRSAITAKSFLRYRTYVLDILESHGFLVDTAPSDADIDAQNSSWTTAEIMQTSVLFINRGKWSFITNFPKKAGDVVEINGTHKTREFTARSWISALEACNAYNADLDRVNSVNAISVSRSGSVDIAIAMNNAHLDEFPFDLIEVLNSCDESLHRWKDFYAKFQRRANRSQKQRRAPKRS
jgi:hypothetical protein